jgi:hypothetical protein
MTIARMLARHVRAHVVGYVALFLALGTGTAVAAVAKNSIRSKHIVNGQVKAADLARSAVTTPKIKNGAITAEKLAKGAVTADKLAPNALSGFDPALVQRRIGATCAAGSAIRAVAQDGGVTCDADPRAPSGPAGGDLTGSYPNPTVAANAVDTAELKDGAVTSAKLGFPLALSQNSLSVPFLKITGAHVAAIPAAAEVDGAMLSVRNSNTNAVGSAVRGEVSSIFGNFGTAGVMGESSGTGGVGVLAYASNPSGNGPAAVAMSQGNGEGLVASSENGNGVKASTDATSGTNAGVYGFVPSWGTGQIGVRGLGSAPTAIGVKGEASDTSGTGVRAEASGTSGTALRAVASGSATQAATFIGNVNVLGTLSKTSGTFKIDHPLDPANQYLLHSFVESPDMKNVYDGVVTTDGRGFATVRMPDWFDALNRDFRYQLTVIGRSFARAIVWEELSHDRFTIRTDEPRVKVSWQVTGIRDDAWARAHPLKVEQPKRGAERGRYLYPELFGKPRSRAIGR